MKTKDILANARIVVRELMSEPDPLPLISACAVAGNGWQENLMRPVTIGPKDHGSDGLLQWRLSRLTELQRRKNWDTLPVQCQFFKDECKRDYPSLWRQLTNPGTRTLENLTANICDIYERPSRAGRKIDLRIGYAKRVMALFDEDIPVQPKPTIPPELTPVVNSPGSTLLGLLSWIMAYISGKDISRFDLDEPWLVWVALGVVLIFFIGDRTKPIEIEDDDIEDSQEEDMNIGNAIKIMRTLVPILEKIVEEIPRIKAEIAELRSMVGDPKSNPETESEDNSILDRISNISDRLNKIMERDNG